MNTPFCGKSHETKEVSKFIERAMSEENHRIWGAVVGLSCAIQSVEKLIFCLFLKLSTNSEILGATESKDFLNTFKIILHQGSQSKPCYAADATWTPVNEFMPKCTTECKKLHSEIINPGSCPFGGKQ